MPEVDVTKRAAELLKQGAVMLPETCPLCGSPLFRLKNGDVVCPIHGKVILAKNEKEVTRVKEDEVIDNLIKKVLNLMSKKLEDLSVEDLNDVKLMLEVLNLAEELRNKLEGKER